MQTILEYIKKTKTSKYSNDDDLVEIFYKSKDASKLINWMKNSNYDFIDIPGYNGRIAPYHDEMMRKSEATVFIPKAGGFSDCIYIYNGIDDEIMLVTFDIMTKKLIFCQGFDDRGRDLHNKYFPLNSKSDNDKNISGDINNLIDYIKNTPR